MGVHHVGDWVPPEPVKPWENPDVGLSEGQQEFVRSLLKGAWKDGFSRGFEEGYCERDGVEFDNEVENPYA